MLAECHSPNASRTIRRFAVVRTRPPSLPFPARPRRVATAPLRLTSLCSHPCPFASPQPNAPIRKRSHAIRKSYLMAAIDSDTEDGPLDPLPLVATTPKTSTPRQSSRPSHLATPKSVQLSSRTRPDATAAIAAATPFPPTVASAGGKSDEGKDEFLGLFDDDLPGNLLIRSHSLQLDRLSSLEEACS